MRRTKTREISDAFWALVEPPVPRKERGPNKGYTRKPVGGRKPAAPRSVFAAIVYAPRNGPVWNALPKKKSGACSSTVHRTFLQWCDAGFFPALWRAGLAEFDETEGIAWTWQSADGRMVKAPLAIESVGKNPTDREKMGPGVPCSRKSTGFRCPSS
jgi:transposase